VNRRALLPEQDQSGELPVRSALPALARQLSSSATAVLVAPAGTGKTSLMPLAVADLVGGRVIVAEPRRIATRAAARRMASLLGEPVGDTVGYAIRGERVGSAGTRVEVVTTGLLVQRLQHDPELAGVDAVILDECHERHLDTDLALACLVEVRATLRPDLMLVATSATADAERISATMTTEGGPAGVITASARQHPVEIVYCPVPRPAPVVRDGRVDPGLLDHVATTVLRALAERGGDVLVFLPGEAEIGAVARRLDGRCGEVDVLTLIGRQSAADQDRVLAAGVRRRVVLSSAVAESSLTVAGVRVVVDAGLSREPRTDHSRGLGSLVTVRVSRASADQRAGRSGRLGPGTAYRCWSAADQVHLPEHAEPEIAVADLAGFALAVARWGRPRAVGLALLDPPPAPAMAAAEQLLMLLDAVDADGRITARGRLMATVGTHPRLARALLDGAERIGLPRAAEVVAILSGDGRRASAGSGEGDDLLAVWRVLRSGGDRAATAVWRAEVGRLTSAASEAHGAGGGPRTARLHSAGQPRTVPDDRAAAIVAGLAFPERLARARKVGSTSYLMAGGTGAELAENSGLRTAGWLAVALADRSPGRTDARIRLAAVLDEATARDIGAGLLVEAEVNGWVNGDLLFTRTEQLGAIVLRQSPQSRPSPAAIEQALRSGLAEEGLALLPWRDGSTSLRARMDFCHTELGEPWSDVSDQALLGSLDSWLLPDLRDVRRRADLANIDLARALRRLLPWPAASRFDEMAPERIELPSGRRARLSYLDGAAPVLAVKLQEILGWTDTPRVAGGRVPVVVHLLSPAGRPVGVTADLASFWRQGYPQVRAELRGRYPRHAWPIDPTDPLSG
jgi:ATP-dependent helicase HrpB